VFHLYPNLLGGDLTISNLLVNQEPASPQYELNDTILRVPLPSPLAPGAHTFIRLEYTVTVPTEVDRNYGIFAFAENTLALAHFFPIVAVHEETGWDIEFPPENGDLTYADVSFYVVTVSAPEKLVLASSGTQVFRGETRTEQTVRYAAGPVRDFYLVGSKDYKVQSKVVGDVTINSYAPRDLQAGGVLAIETVERSLLDFNDRYGTYPYSEFDVVTISTYAYGVEYPGITAIGLHIFDLNGDKDGVPIAVYLESTVAHEFGHQYFYNMVGSDQLEEPWLDESLVQYITWQYYADQYGPEGASGFGGSLYERWNRVEMEEIPIGMPVASYEGKEYGAIVYGRGAFFFEELEKLMGVETFDEFLRDYVEMYKWENASGGSFKQLAEVHCACDLTPLFEEWVE